MDSRFLQTTLTLAVLLAAGCGGAVVEGEYGTGTDAASASARPCAADDASCPQLPPDCDPSDTACAEVAPGCAPDDAACTGVAPQPCAAGDTACTGVAPQPCPADDPGCARVPPQCDPTDPSCAPPPAECRTADDCPAPASPLCEGACDGGRCVIVCPAPVGSCDDGTQAICDRRPPVCAADELLAVQDGCELCVDPATCRPVGEGECRSTDDCPAPAGPGCYATCDGGQCGISCAHQVECHTADECPQPDGPGCYATCLDGLCGIECRRPCSDGTEVICRQEEPACADGLLLTIQGGCWACVDPSTCAAPSADVADSAG